MPMLADPKLELFKRYRAFDDFEDQPLHGTFLIDAEGDVRFQRISADPFLESSSSRPRPRGSVKMLGASRNVAPDSPG